MTIEELKDKLKAEIIEIENAIEDCLKRADYSDAQDLKRADFHAVQDLKLRKIETNNFIKILDQYKVSETTEEWEPVRFTEEIIDGWIEDEGFPQYQYIHLEGLKLMLMITERALAVAIFKQDEKWYLKESVEYNGFTINSSIRPGLYADDIDLRGSFKDYDNVIVQRNFTNTDKLKEYLLKMLQSLEYAEYKLEKEIEK